MNITEQAQRFQANEPLFDKLMNSYDLSYLDANQKVRYTWSGLEQAFIDRLTTWGRQELGDWKIGLVVRARNEVVLYNNFLYRFDGDLPHTITGANPTEDSGEWVNIGKVTDALLAGNNLNDVADKAMALKNLGGADLNLSNTFNQGQKITILSEAPSVDIISDITGIIRCRSLTNPQRPRFIVGLNSAAPKASLELRRFSESILNGTQSIIELHEDGRVRIANEVANAELLITADGRLLFKNAELVSIGVSQTWKDVKSIRMPGVNYTNTTGRPISVSVSLSAGSVGISTLVVDEVKIGALTPSGITQRGQLSVIVPPNSIYRLDRDPAAVTSHFIEYWVELS